MAEIDEAAAEQYASLHIATVKRYYPLQLRSQSMQTEYNLCRAALAWKARAERAEAELKSFETQLSDYARRATNDEQVLLARAEAAEAERDRLKATAQPVCNDLLCRCCTGVSR